MNPECGTYAGWHRHRYRDEPTCDPCKKACSAYNRAYRRRTVGAPAITWTERIVDYLDTYGPATIGAVHARIADDFPGVKHETIRRSIQRLYDRDMLPRKGGGTTGDPYVYSVGVLPYVPYRLPSV